MISPWGTRSHPFRSPGLAHGCVLAAKEEVFVARRPPAGRLQALAHHCAAHFAEYCGALDRVMHPERGLGHPRMRASSQFPQVRNTRRPRRSGALSSVMEGSYLRIAPWITTFPGLAIMSASDRRQHDGRRPAGCSRPTHEGGVKARAGKQDSLSR